MWVDHSTMQRRRACGGCAEEASHQRATDEIAFQADGISTVPGYVLVWQEKAVECLEGE